MSDIEEESMRDALEDAIGDDDVEIQAAEVIVDESETSIDEESENEVARDDLGRYAEKGDTEAEVSEEVVVESLVVPQSWKPSAREEWANLPVAIQEEVLRRETDINSSLNDSASTRKLGEELTAVAQPYMAMIEAEGSTPVQAAENMFRTSAMLKTGSPMQKAGVLAEIAQMYSVDIGLLDEALSGNMPIQQNQQYQQPQQQEFRDPRFDQLMNQMQAKENAASNQKVVDFSNDKEFFADVRLDMADLIEMSEKRGVALSLDDAYNKAVAMNPDISGVIAQRANAQNGNPSTSRSRRASSSIKSNHISGSKAKPESLRGALEDAIQTTG